MIIIAGWVEIGDPARVAEALEGGKAFMTPVRAQKGNLDYTWTADRVIPGRIYVYERWEDEPSLATHLAGQNYRNMLGHMGQFGLKGMDILKYRIDLAEPVYDSTGTPRADFFTDQA